MKKPVNFSEYLADFPEETQRILEELRTTIKEAAPQAVEVMSYGMPGFKSNGMVVWFAAHKNHIGFYPKPSGIEVFKNELSIYKGAKGSIQFPIDQPLPLGLITQIVKFRLDENLQKAKTKAK